MSTTTVLPAPLPLPPIPAWRRSLRRSLGHRGLLLGSVVLGLIALAALFAPWLSPHDPYAQEVTQRLIPPAWYGKGNGAETERVDMVQFPSACACAGRARR